MFEEIKKELHFSTPQQETCFTETLQNVLPELKRLADAEGAETSDCFLRAFAEAVWKLEKHCHSIAAYPVESVFSPNYDVYRCIGLYLLQSFFHNDDIRIEHAITNGLQKGILWPRFAHLMSAQRAREHGRLLEAYEHAQKAHAEFAHCGASYRMHYECWNACREAGLPVQESFPPQEQIRRQFCSYPFDFLVIRNDGDLIRLAPCQTSLWMAYAKSYPANELIDEHAKPDFWNCKEFQEIRRSILDGDFSYCSKLRCTKFMNLPDRDKVTDARLRHIIDTHQTELPGGPRVIVCSYDETCNLTCPSCRTHPIAPTPAQRHAFDTMADRFILPLISSETDHILLNASGEALASPHSMRLLQSIPFDRYPKLKIHLMTNGELLADRWSALGEAASHVHKLIISFDGLSKHTYEQYRRNGKLERFLNGMEFASKLRKEDIVKSVTAVMTVYEGNMHEALPIFHFCRSHEFDDFALNKFQNWGTFSPEKFAAMDIWNKQHPRYEEWKQIFNQIFELGREGHPRVTSTNMI